MVEARARTTRRSHQAEDPADIPAQLAEPPPDPAPPHQGAAAPPSAVQRTELAVTSLRDDLQELIGLLKARPAEPVTYQDRLNALKEARVYVEGLINTRGSFKANAGPESRLNLELQVAAYLIGERIEAPQLPADHIEDLRRQ